MRNPFKLQKLRIESFNDAKRKRSLGLKSLLGASDDSMEVMFNPESYSTSQEVHFQTPQGINMPEKPARYSLTRPETISLKIVLDGTGVSEIGAISVGRAIAGRSVNGQIERFKKLCLHLNGEIHEPPYLRVTWGSLAFKGRLKTLDIHYTLFDKGGDPLRAELSVVFIQDEILEAIARKAGKKSPDLTRRRVVRRGDTLPLLARDAYGSAEHYLFLARANQLDDFRRLVPGQELVFPPLPSTAVSSMEEA